MKVSKISFITFLFCFSLLIQNSACGKKPTVASQKQQYKIAVCDWMILKRQKLGAFERTKEIGADGLELDMGGLGNRPTFDNKLLDPVERKIFLDKSKETGIEIASIAMSGFYAQSFPTRDGVERLTERLYKFDVPRRCKNCISSFRC